MKKLFTYKISIVIFTVLFLMTCPNLSAQTKDSDLEKDTLPLLNYCDLRNNADRYDGQTVRLKAQIHGGQHGESLYDENCPGEQNILDYPDGLAAVFYENKSDQIKIGEIRDKRLKRKDKQKLWTDSVNVTVIGIFKKNKPMNGESSYERNAPFHFFIKSIDFSTLID